MGTRAKQRAENEGIMLDFTYGVIDKCILKALLGEDSLILTTESMINRVYQRVDSYGRESGIRISVKHLDDSQSGDHGNRGGISMTAIPCIVIAGTHSGCGKTTIACGIMAALTARGLKVQPFKTGPDFIDPSHHTRICQRTSRNLDPFMMGEQGCIDTFIRATTGADIAVIEGVMGLYDGIDGTDFSSTAHVARILNAPVILVVDIKGMSRSVQALIRGYREFDTTISIAGVILNRVGSLRHRRMIDGSVSLPTLGWIPKREDIALESRHLGLKMAHETGSMTEFGSVIEEFCDLEALIALAKKEPASTAHKKVTGGGSQQQAPVTDRCSAG